MMENIDRPIFVLENGTDYEFQTEDMLKLKDIIYFCDICNAFHVKEEKLDNFNDFVKKM